MRHAATFHQAGQYAEAEELYLSILGMEPKHPDANHNLGLLALQLGQRERALPFLQSAWEADPSVGQYWLTLAECLLALGRFEDAQRLVDEAAKRGMKTPQVQQLRLLAKRGRQKTSPSVALVHQALALFRAGRNAELESHVLPLLDQYPGWVLGWNALGAALQLQDKDAEYALRRAAQLAPHDAEVQNNLGVFLRKRGRLDEALACIKASLEAKPKFAEGYLNLGVVLFDLGRFDEAVSGLKQALNLKPEYAEAYNAMGAALRELGAFSEAESACRRALEINPQYADAYCKLGLLQIEMGQVVEAISSYRRALTLDPGIKVAANNFLFALNYHPDMSAEDIYAEYRKYDEQHCLPLHVTWQEHGNARDPERRLKVGYVSPDFRFHSMRHFLEPLLAHHDKRRVEVYAYAELANEDGVTARYRSYADHWVGTKGMSDEELAERIRADGIDILVELAGHTAQNRLGVFARKPAPVSLSWLGYGYTTGLSAIDYFLTDEASVPAGGDHLFSETPWRIATPAYAYRPAEGMGEVGELPAMRCGHVTFGTLTRAIRVNHRTIRVWSEILKRVPNSRLMIDSRNFAGRYMRDRLTEMFAAAGIDRERLEIGCHSPPWDVLRGMDIGLDCFPHNSGTTLFEHLYMGAPYVTLADRPSVGRLGSCILQGGGHPEWIAESEEEYIAKAVALASDLPRLAQIRANLRAEMEHSPLMDEAGFARKVEDAYRAMWKKWCGVPGSDGDVQEILPDDLLKVAATHHQAGRNAEAEAMYLAILQTEPAHADAHYNLGLLRMQQGLAEQALPHLQAAWEADPTIGQYWLTLAECLLALECRSDALLLLKTAVRRGMNSRELPPLLMRALEDRGALPDDGVMHECLALFNSGRFAELKELMWHLLDEYPGWAWGWKMLGTTQQRLGDGGEMALRCALELEPRDAEAHNTLGLVLHLLGRHEEALDSVRRALEFNPGYADAINNEGIILVALGDRSEAEAAYRRVIEINPNSAEAHNNLAVVLMQRGDLQEALASCRRALEIRPDFADAFCNLGSVQSRLGLLDAAEASYRRALEGALNRVEVLASLGDVLRRRGRLDDAQTILEHILEISPDHIDAINNLGIVLEAKGLTDEAEACYRRALVLKPDHAGAYNNLGALLKQSGRLDEALDNLRHAAKLGPDYVQIHQNIANTLADMGELPAAMNSYRHAREVDPGYIDVHDNLLFALNYHPDMSAEDIYSEYRKYDEQHCLPLRATWREHGNARDPERRLKVGYVSPDFRQHSTRHFLEPLLARHDKRQVEVYAYAELGKEDDMTARYRGYVDHWVATKGMSDEELAERIRTDGIDILVELAGHTAHNRLGVFARKPAPVSLSWLGYGYTTGLSAIDYFLTDEASVPAGSEHLFSETPWRIATPAYAYRPGEGMGEVGELPALRRGHVTFGTLTRAIRVNHRTIRVWSEILKRVPGSRLMIDSYHFTDQPMRERLASKFSAHGIGAERLEIGYHTPPWDVLRGMDIGLDCFPHNSGTTLFEHLYMGVPYVTLAGRSSLGRLGSSVLQGVGHPEWIAQCEDEYIAKAVELAGDLPRLLAVRAGLRGEMEHSPLMDEAGFARKVEAAYRTMWHAWCVSGR
ncbi:MAG TPA: tetratricopeptide repeat protein [Gallionella sp.]|nr:tetratricopeptide repeat protein [Gallionella sp.]